MAKYYIKTTETVCIIPGERMVEKGDYLYVYGADDELIGMFQVAAIIDAHRTEGK